MKLIGNYLSPYVRRVAISLEALAVPFELQSLYVFKEPEMCSRSPNRCGATIP